MSSTRKIVTLSRFDHACRLNLESGHDCRLMLKGRKCEMSLKGGDAQQGELITKYDGGRPTHADYNPMRKQGGLVLGTGGDNSDRAMGIFCKLLSI